MFKESIQSTAFTSSSAESAFAGKIDGDAFRGDKTVLSVLRALLGQRIQGKEHIKVNVKEFWTANQDFRETVQKLASGLRTGQLSVISVAAHGEDSKKWMPSAKEILDKSALHELVALEKWFEQSNVPMLVYSDSPFDPAIPKSPVDNTKTLLVIENLSFRTWHLLGALLPRFFGYWFQKAPRTELESKLLMSTQRDTPDEMQRLLTEIASAYDFRSAEIRNLLNGFESRRAKTEAKRLQSKVDASENKIRDLMTKLGQEQAAREKTLAMLWGYQEHMNKAADSFTMEYFLANKNLYLKGVADNMLDFYATAWLTNWDPEQADVTFGKEHCSSWYAGSRDADVPDEDALLLFKAIFLEETVKVKMWSHYRLFLDGESALQFGTNDALPEFQSMLPNPHHFYYQCGGSNCALVAQRIMDGDIVGAIAQCVSATGGLNLIEQVSYSHFVSDLFGSSKQVVYINETGAFATAKEAIQYLKKKQKKEQAKEAAK